MVGEVRLTLSLLKPQCGQLISAYACFMTSGTALTAAEPHVS
jgi:hypothetical protein